jgi:hypothetical protein
MNPTYANFSKASDVIQARITQLENELRDLEAQRSLLPLAYAATSMHPVSPAREPTPRKPAVKANAKAKAAAAAASDSAKVMFNERMEAEAAFLHRQSLIADQKRREASHAAAISVMPGVVARTIAKAQSGPSPLFSLTPSDRQNVSIEQLRRICELRGLYTIGNKAALIDRIITHVHNGADLIKYDASVNKGGKSQKRKSRDRHRKTRRSH